MMDHGAEAADLFAGDGEMVGLCAAMDWSTTALGPVSTWSHSLRATVGSVLHSRHPMFLFWGPELVQFYNDGYRPSLGEDGRHPRALGMRGREFWTDIWDAIGPQIHGVMTGGLATWHEDQLLPIVRNGRFEEVYWTYSYSPVRDDGGGIAGTLVVCQETTPRVIAERRLLTLHRLGAIATQPTGEAAAAEATRVIAADALDVPFALCYLDLPGAGHDPAAGDPPALVHAAGLAQPVELGRWPLREAMRSGEPQLVDITGWPEAAGAGPWPEPPTAAVVLPLLAPNDERSMGALVVGLSPRLPWDERYRDFVQAAATNVAARVAARRLDAERERLVRELEVERSRLEEIFRRAPAFLAVVRGPDHVLELANDAYYQLVGHHEVIGKPAFEAIPEIRDQGFEALLTRVRESGVPFVGREVPLRVQPTPGAPPEVRFIDFIYQPLVEADGTRTGVIAHGSDVTAQVLARREIEAARQSAEAARAEAEAANRAKGEFLATMSHELRTPLNAIGGYAELIELGIHGPVTPAQAQALARIQSSQRHLLGLINGVLNYARVDAGAVSYQLEPVRVTEVLTVCEALTAPQMRAKGLEFRDERGCDPPPSVLADREKLQQVLLNLLSNATKFTDHGGAVTVRCAADASTVALWVTDTGHGIPADQLARVFEPFVQVDARLTRTHEGVGLGLAISRDLARGMGGDLTVASTLGVGSTFTLTLPRAS